MSGVAAFVGMCVPIDAPYDEGDTYSSESTAVSGTADAFVL
jgi:hypothetical protein